MNNVYILYPPYTGGNHLINLLLTSPKLLADSQLPTNFRELLSDFYLNNLHSNAHFLTGFDVGILKTIKKNIYCGHLVDYLVDDITRNTNLILLDMPTEDSASGLRIKKHKFFEDGYFWGEQTSLYKEDIVKRLRNVVNVIDVSTELFHTCDTPVFQQISDKLDLNLDTEFCINLHNLWMEKIYGV